MAINDRLKLITSDADQVPSLGALLKAARVRAGVEQRELADALGLSRQSVSNFETDKVVPVRAVVIAIAFLLGADFGPLDEAHARVAGQRHGGSRRPKRGEPAAIHRKSDRYRPLRPMSKPMIFPPRAG